jgi:phosphoglycolate phosphatase
MSFLPEAIFFDLDGTLVDSAPDIQACLFDALREQGMDTTNLLERFRIGPPLDRMIQAMVPDLSEAQRVAVVTGFRSRYDQSDYPLTVPYEGIAPLLSELASTGIPLFVATNKPFFASTRIVNKQGWHCFDAILSPDSFSGERLAKASLLMRTAQARGYCPEKCLMIGDLPEDVEAARKAGFKCVAVLWGYGDGVALSQCGADWVMSDPSELCETRKGLSYV